MTIKFMPIRNSEVAERDAKRLAEEGWKDVKLSKYESDYYVISAKDLISEAPVLFDNELRVHYYWRSLNAF